MTFISLEFLLFVSLLIVVYYSMPKKYQWVVLLLFSYIYFWINSKLMIVFLFLTTLISFEIAKANSKVIRKYENIELDSKIKKNRIKADQKRNLIFGVTSILSLLVVLKYSGFLINQLNKLFNVKIVFSLAKFNIFIPLGISYYTLMSIGYMIDVYRKKYEAENNLLKYMLFISYFPHILQGPISRFNQLASQLFEEHHFNKQNLIFGIQLVIWGLMKKMIIADRLATPVNEIFNNYMNYQGLIVFFGAALYGMQIYTDFSGGIDIVRGVSQMLGIELAENFKQPYLSSSIEDFWRRWHITLGSWMKDYVFYPLSLSKSFGKLGKLARKLVGPSFGKKLPAFISMFIVYLFVGIWHGPEWKYVAYGLWNGIFIMCGIMFEDLYTKMRHAFGIDDSSVVFNKFRILRTFIIVSLGRYFSRAAGLKVALKMFRNTLIKWQDLSFLTNGTLVTLGLDTANWIIVVIFIGILLYVDSLHNRSVSIRAMLSKEAFIFRWSIFLLAILCLLIFGIYGPSYDAVSFIYEQF